MEIYSTLSGILVKIGLLNKSARDPVTAIITVVDFLVAWICKWKIFKAAINYFISDWNNREKSLKWLFYGKAIGTLFNAIENSKSFSELYVYFADKLLKCTV